MTKTVIDVFKSIQIQHQQGNPVMISDCQIDGMAEINRQQCTIGSWKSAFYSSKIQINILRYIEPYELTIYDDELENKDTNKDIEWYL